MKPIDVKTNLNKRNGQVTISLPKNKFPLEIKNKWTEIKKMKIEIKDVTT